MASKPNKSELHILEQYRNAFESSRNQPVIKEQVALFGYTEEKLDEGWSIYQNTMSVWNRNKQEDRETADAYRKFLELYQQQEALYSLDRKKMRAAFIWEPEVLKKLGITGEKPRAYLEVMDHMKVCYGCLNEEDELQVKVAHMQITPEYLTESLDRLSAIEQVRSLYVREECESQAATDEKDQALAQLDRWMREYLAVARIALEEQPQLLEALGILVRN